jgi:NAD(P)-dependent dehydrogenase (short-subunit alcohol dehydrogenase family)/uncharacterized OB-fold protein
MTDPLGIPPKKNPQKRTVSPTLPPAVRSRAAIGLSAAAAEGRLMLQSCAECASLQYPPRDACSTCLSVDLRWQDVDPSGQLLAETTIQTSTNLYFRERAPWRVGSVKLNDGPLIICHVHGDVEPNATVILWNRLDRSGQGVLLAVPQKETPNMRDDPQLRALTADPKHRRILITDGRNPNAPALAQAMVDAEASMIFVGMSEVWRPDPNLAALEEIKGVSVIPLDVTDTKSVQELAAEIGGKVDILINNARFVRPGGVAARGDTNFAATEMDVNYFGLMRLAQAFGPGMAARAADGDNSAAAWVNILSAYALVNSPDYGCFSASNAAALSLSQNMRAEFRASGVRIANVFVGPTDDDWHQPLPPPKVLPNALGRSVVAGLKDGLEDIFCGDVAKDIAERLRAGAKVLEREMTDGGGV